MYYSRFTRFIYKISDLHGTKTVPYSRSKKKKILSKINVIFSIENVMTHSYDEMLLNFCKSQ